MFDSFFVLFACYNFCKDWEFIFEGDGLWFVCVDLKVATFSIRVKLYAAFGYGVHIFWVIYLVIKEERGDGKHYLFLSADSQKMQEA